MTEQVPSDTTLYQDRWYIPEPSPTGRSRYPRWLLGERDGVVVYSKGGSHHYSCKAKTFQKWIKTFGAKPAEKRR